ncbi:MAG TPA: DNA polymerase domain-containing protein, partial [Isosphaeraceae bacterium]|nr:DNA polymerase domain-containing protein [Isosphaeraceae bacterium]
MNPTTGRHACVDGDRARLAAVLDQIRRAGQTLVSYNGDHYDLPLVRAILGGEEDFYEVSRSLVTWEGHDLPPELEEPALGWPKIRADRIDLAARTKDHGHIKALKVVAASLGAKHLAELPYDPERSLSDEEWEEVKRYNQKDLEDTKVVLDHFSPELDALSALSQKYGMDLRSTHPAGVASRVLCAAYQSQHGADPVRVEPPGRIRYRPPAAVRRPQNPIAAARFDRLVTEEFPLIVGKKSKFPKPVVPPLAAPIEIGGLKLNEGKGGLISQDKPVAHRADAEHEILDVDVASYYPSMIAEFNIAPKSLGTCGADLFREILTTRLDLKEQAAQATDPVEAKRLKAQADGLKIVLNSVFGQFGQFHSKLYDPEAALAVTLTGQFLLLNLVERLAEAGVTLLAVHTDGVLFKARRESSEAWRGVLSDWQTDTNLTLESTPVAALVIEATNRYLIQYADGRTKRRGSGLGDQVDWRHVPNRRTVADAVVAALLHGKLPEDTIRACTDPFKFTSLTRRKKSQQSELVDGRGSIQPLGQIIRWYWAQGEGAQIRIRGRDCNGKEFTRKAAEGVQLLPDLPDGPLGDIDYGRYIAEARERILACRDFPHLDPQWLADSPAAQDLYARGLSPAPKWDGKKSPKGSKVQFPSYFWPWGRYDAFGTHTGPEVGLLVLDSDKPPKFRGWVDDGLVPNAA